MWVDRKLYDDIRKRLWETAAVNSALEKQITSQQSTIDWMAVRLTQVEHEKAQLLFNYTGVKVAAPVFHKDTPTDPDLLQQTHAFVDVGDDVAKQMGIGWDAHGSLVYGK